MKVDRNVDLYSQNTMRLHSIADTVYYPESTNDLMEVLGQNKTDCLILAAGSNVILPERLHRPVISLMSLNESLEVLDDGRAHVGCSVRVQKLIRFLQDNGLGGIEYLYSVPASLGGLVYMNGGRGKKYNMSIADYLDEVEYLDLDDMTAKTMRVRRADFTYRHSPFQDMNAIILSAFFRFKAQDANDTEALIKERLASPSSICRRISPVAVPSTRRGTSSFSGCSRGCGPEGPCSVGRRPTGFRTWAMRHPRMSVD